MVQHLGILVEFNVLDMAAACDSIIALGGGVFKNSR